MRPHLTMGLPFSSTTYASKKEALSKKLFWRDIMICWPFGNIPILYIWFSNRIFSILNLKSGTRYGIRKICTLCLRLLHHKTYTPVEWIIHGFPESKYGKQCIHPLLFISILCLNLYQILTLMLHCRTLARLSIYTRIRQWIVGVLYQGFSRLSGKK